MNAPNKGANGVEQEEASPTTAEEPREEPRALAPNPRLCPCGSGLRPLRCCSQDLATINTAGATRHVAPLAEQAAASG